MDTKQYQEREQLRRLFTRTVNRIEKHIQDNENSSAIIEFEFLKESAQRLQLLDATIQKTLLEEYDQTKYEQECDQCAEIRHKFLSSKFKMETMMQNALNKETTPTTCNLSLPKIEQTKFNDDPRTWISFWGQFRKIHGSTSLALEDKFQYLLQGLQEGSKVRALIESFPPSAANYTKAVEELQERFGREDILIQTLVVNVTHNGKSMKIRALLDSGSQRSYVKSLVARALQLQEVGVENIKHTLFGGDTKPAQVYRLLSVKVSNFINDSFSLDMVVFEQQNLCGHLPTLQDAMLLQNLKSHNIEVNDDNIEIGLLIGSDYLGSIMTSNLVPINNGLLAVETKLGWTIQGPTKLHGSVTNTISVTYVSQTDISNLWNIELLGIQEPYEQQKKEVAKSEILKYFNDNISINKEGHYEVPLLWKEGCPEPETNYDVARKRLESTTKKLIKTSNLQSYTNIFKEWQKEGIIEEVVLDNKNEGHYIPHHPVIKPTSATTKLRPVFDASAKDCKGLSLNDCMDKGSNLIELIPRLLILFRRGAYGVIADIAKAFLQVSARKNDRKYLKFLWWKNPEEQNEIVTYQHNRVMFGVNCSPFLLSATINYHLDNCSEKYNKTAQKLKESFYVDNCTASFDTLEQRDTFISQSKELMELAKFDLRGWITAPETIEKGVKDVAVLGMSWNIEDDTLRCYININSNHEKKITKRYLLSVTQQIFDPLGVLCPVTIIPKRILQRVWERKLDWDDEVSSDLAHEFRLWQSQMHLLQKCEIPRRLAAAPLEESDISFHTFCDASGEAYAACVYLRTQQKGKVCVQLVLAKSRIAPANKEMSLPRLELMGAVIASRLYREVIASGLVTSNVNYKSYFWTDSTVVLAWLKQQRQWKPFVSNRVKEITQNTKIEEWKHIPGGCNPADLPSRGCNASKLLENRWWDGPTWLRRDREHWPTSNIIELKPNEDIVRSEEKTQSTVSVATGEAPFITRLMYFSKYNQIVRLVAWLHRWTPRARKQFNYKGNLSNDEYLYAERVLIKLLQKEDFSKASLPNNLNVYEGSDGIIRVKTRLDLSHEHEDFVNPILLSGKNEIVRRFVRQRHEILQHAGTQILLSSVRNEFWILNIRRLARKIIAECVICKKHKSKHYEIPEAPLPADRLKMTTVFQATGIDLAGPLFLRDCTKCWIVLFTCATYRAIHLELVESLSTNSFIMALRRFTARRGRVQIIYTDNGTNFQGTANLLKNVDWKQVEATTAFLPQPIKWKFIPPASPWWGGWWERLVGVMREMLRRILGKASLTWIELSTILCECESVINSRPLTYVATDDDTPRPLTPAMFLHGLSTAETPDLDQVDTRGMNIRLRYLQTLRAEFRQRFRNEYLATLISKSKCKSNLPSVGDIVLVETDSSRLHWPLGIIKELVSGKDGMTRVARVQTANGEKVRTCQRLYPLELSAVTNEWHRIPTNDARGKPENIDLQTRSSCVLDPVVSSPEDEPPNTQVGDDSQPTTATTRHGRTIRLPRRFLD